MCYDTFSPIVIQEKNMFNDGNVQCVFISKIRSLHFIFPFTKKRVSFASLLSSFV